MRPPTRRLLLLFAGTAVVAGPLAAIAIGQQQSPESLLPQGFGQPEPTPPPPPPAQPGEAPPPAVGAPDPIGQIIAQLGDETVPPEDPEAAADDAAKQEMPEAARRPLSPIGSTSGYGADAFGIADGRFLTILIDRMSAPVASRWMQILLRRTLLTRVETPARADDADWIAARAGLLLRLGEADAARLLVQSVDVQNFTPKLRSVAILAALATADPQGLCPLSDGGEQVGGRPMWPMVRVMCASLAGEPADAGVFPRESGGLRPIDIQVAEKVTGAGPVSRRAITLDWTMADGVTDWRFGLATATGAALPDDLLAHAAPRYRAYAARAPMLPLDKRIAMARTAVALGVLSSQDVVDLYGQALEAQGDYRKESPAGQLRSAYVGDDDAAKLTALRAIWAAAAESPEATYAAQILTARACARIKPASASNDDIVPLIAAMLSAGLDRQAAHFAGEALGLGGEAGDRAWAMLATGVAGGVAPVDRARVEAFVKRAGTDPENGGPHRSRILIAALGGLGRIGGDDLAQLAAASGLDLGQRTAWTGAIDRAASRGEKGTVILLAAAAMQTPTWQAAPPALLFRTLSAFRRVGLDAEARMIASEAMTRL